MLCHSFVPLLILFSDCSALSYFLSLVESYSFFSIQLGYCLLQEAILELSSLHWAKRLCFSSPGALFITVLQFQNHSENIRNGDLAKQGPTIPSAVSSM